MMFFQEKILIWPFSDNSIALSFQQHKSQKIRTFYGLIGCFSSEIWSSVTWTRYASAQW